MPDLAPAFHAATPPGEDRERRVCDHCGWVDYVNPRIVVGTVATWTGDGAERILLCRRAIEPRLGFWTLPAGYMETGEDIHVAAAREAREEACCELEIEGLLAVYDVPHIAQVQLMFRGRLSEPAFAAGPESLEVGLFAWEDIPWGELAFSTVAWALNHWREGRHAPLGAPRRNPAPGDPAGAPPPTPAAG